MMTENNAVAASNAAFDIKIPLDVAVHLADLLGDFFECNGKEGFLLNFAKFAEMYEVKQLEYSAMCDYLSEAQAIAKRIADKGEQE